jgi:uncharacterized repeat protein (TIGR01451 family)
MKEFDRTSDAGTVSHILRCLAVILAFLQSPQFLFSQAHYLYDANAAPGELAFKALLGNPNWTARVQPVKVVTPEGSLISVWNQGQFEVSDQVNPVLGMTIGPVYRFRVSNIPRAEAAEVYPSIELLNQLTPPEGMETRFPIRIVLDEQDLRIAAAGRMVTKVIYLENPDLALPYRETADDQAILEAGQGEDPLRTAERFGRPMAIVRLGSRIPSAAEMDAAFQFSGIPLTLFPPEASQKLNEDWNRVEQVSFAVPTASNSPEPKKKQDCGCSLPHCGCSSHVWQGFSCDPPLWNNWETPTLQTGPARDEFLCDGDDRNFRVAVRNDGTLVGLDREDTIGHFETIDGVTKVTSSNRVCIYSPRFAAVRKLSQSYSTTETARVGSMNERIETRTSSRKQASSITKQQLQLQANRGATHAGNIVDQTRGIVAENTLVPSGFRAGFAAFENLQLMRIGKHRASESARLSLGMQAAGVWDDIRGLQVAERNIQPVIARDPQRVQEIRSVDSETTSQLRLCKIASKLAAEPGEEIEFSIRFDNIGAAIINKVTIIDNLTTRLEYIPDSAECSMPAEFVAEENDGGSLVLSWKVTDPIQVGSGGLIRFRCRVR